MLEALGMLGRVSTEVYKLGANEFLAGIAQRVKWDAKEPEREAKRKVKKQAFKNRVANYLLTGKL